MKYRTCSKCEEELPLEEDNFHHDKNDSEGFAKICKDCANKYQREYSKHKWDEPPPKEYSLDGFDQACHKDWLRRMTAKTISVDREAF